MVKELAVGIFASRRHKKPFNVMNSPVVSIFQLKRRLARASLATLMYKIVESLFV
jgi:hypothetical protein